MPTKPWLKLWTSIRTNTDIRCAPPATRWAFIALLCLARELSQADTGRLERHDQPLNDEQLADAVGLPLDQWLQARAYWIRTGNLALDGDTLVVANFAKHQASDPTGAQRQAKYRAKTAGAAKSRDASRNASPHAPDDALRDASPDALRDDARVQRNRVQNTDNRDRDREIDNSTPTPDPEPLAPTDADTVDISLFLSVIGFKDPEAFMRNVDRTLIAKWAFYYNSLTPQQRAAIRNWASLINDRCRKNQPPRLTGAQSAAFYRLWKQAPWD